MDFQNIYFKIFQSETYHYQLIKIMYYIHIIVITVSKSNRLFRFSRRLNCGFSCVLKWLHGVDKHNILRNMESLVSQKRLIIYHNKLYKNREQVINF